MIHLTLAGLASALVLAAAAEGPPPAESPPEGAEVITGEVFHLGNTDKPEWKEFTTEKPHHSSRLEIPFEVKGPIETLTLEVRSGGVGDAWKVRVNHRELGELKRGEELHAQFLEIPAGLVKSAGNQLVVDCATVQDDIHVGPIYLHHRTLKEMLRLSEVVVRVVERPGGRPLPCRLTVTRPKRPRKDDPREEERAELLVEENRKLAVRKGLIYAAEGQAVFNVPAGRYRLYATRGFEYGVAAVSLNLLPSERKVVDLELEREVDTEGYLAADTHIHTKTHSLHGDASVEERLVTIAGEGVEVAIATDHNHHTDYRPEAKKLGLSDEFCSVVGNEFTTYIGHFNAFPVEKDARPAAHSSRDWMKLLKALRATPGVEVVICNHPRRPKADEQAFDNIDLNPLSGEAHHGPQWLGIDAVEVLNAKGLHDEEMLTFHDWFGLLNRGLRLAAVAGSDSHTVEGIVGQSRTYVKCSATEPARADVRELTRSFLKGRLLVSLGLLARARVDGRFEVGDLAGGLGETVKVEVSVSGPRWAKADHVALYLNGQLTREERIRHPADAVVKYEATWEVPRPPHDAHLVVVATGPPITAPYWALAQEKKYLMGATNPIWLDCDGDGRFTSAREYALHLTGEYGEDPASMEKALRRYDAAVAVQVASIFRSRIQAEMQMEYERLLDRANRRLEGLLTTPSPRLNSRFQSYLKAAPTLDVYSRTDQEAREEMLRKEEERERKEREERDKRAREKRKRAARNL